MKAKSGITKDDLIAWGGEDVFNQAFALCQTGSVKGFSYDHETRVISGKIEQADGWDMPVSFVLESRGRIKSNCTCRTNQLYGQVCAHVVALGIAIWVSEMDEVPARRSSAAARLPSSTS